MDEKQKNALRRVAEIEKQRQALNEELHRIVCEAFPIGCVVTVRLGRAEVTGPVVNHSRWAWSSPGRIYVRNASTGKVREVAPYDLAQQLRREESDHAAGA